MRRVSILLPLRVTALVMVLVVAGLGGCTGARETPPAPRSQPSPSPSAAATVRPVSLSLMVFNVEYGGSPATDAVIADLHPDVVGVLESYDRLPRIAAAAGYPYYDVGLQILSRYPILEPSGADGLYAYLEVRPGEAVALVNTHLDYVQDGPRRLAHGVPVADVLTTERRVRLSSIDTLLPSATRLLGQGWPVLFTGDLNEPSHLDWTARTAARHGGVGAVAWPVSRALVGAGLRDAYRLTHPDPLTDPGNTWGGVAGGPGSPRRIDFAYVGGPVRVRSSQVVGERGGAGVDLGYPRWTSDHRAVLSRLSLTPSPIPTTVALSSRLVTRGETVTAYAELPAGASGGRLVLSGPTTAAYDVDGRSATVAVPTRRLPAGVYRVTLQDPDGTVVATNELTVRPRQVRVRLTTDAPSYAVGQPVTVRWADGPANRWDWVAVYRAGAADPADERYLVWGYTGGHDAGALPPTTNGELVLGRDQQGAPWPLPTGRYVVHYLLKDQDHSVATTRFRVR